MKWTKRTQHDVILALGAVGLLAILLVPLPPMVLALLQTLNLSVALVILLATLYSRDSLDTSSFPSLLLFTTLFRVALNVSASRLILLHANAGPVIAAFGRFLMGSDPVVGFATFVILVIVQFVVVTRGAERVAEVAARFTLDAMPGKQMAIDEDLHAGIINDTTARQRRVKIEREADFYGAMDGASKFMRGDAIAGILIVVVNMIGGLLIGVLRAHMGFGAAASTYALLTVGDGLVTQVPALLLSIATGIVVTRAAGDTGGDISDTIAAQLFANPRAAVGGVIAIAILGLIPGLPHLPFLLIAAVGGGALWWQQRRKAAETTKPLPLPVAKEQPLSVVEPPPVTIRYGSALTTLVQGPLPGHLRAARRDVAAQLGLLVPEPELVQDHGIALQQYIIEVHGAQAGSGTVRLSQVLLLEGRPVETKMQGEVTTDPTFGLPALWVPETERTEARRRGYQTVEPSAVIATHFGVICQRRAADLFGRAQCKAVLDQVRSAVPSLVEDLIPQPLQTWQVQRVFQGLLAENVPVRSASRILEALAEAADRDGGKETEPLVEAARRALASEIMRSPHVAKARDVSGRLRCLVLSPDWEMEIARQAPGRLLGMGELCADVGRALASNHEGPCVLLCAPEIRPRVRAMLQRALPVLAVISTAEIPGDVQVSMVAQVPRSGGQSLAG